jgi:hypothetical protein
MHLIFQKFISKKNSEVVLMHNKIGTDIITFNLQYFRERRGNWNCIYDMHYHHSTF